MKKHWTRRFLCLLACVLFLLPQAGMGACATLKAGDRNEDVLRMQQALSDLGYPLKADGIFGKGTQAAVRAFQRDHGLKVDGKAGNQTLGKLYGLAGGHDAPTQTILGETQTPAIPTPSSTAALTPPPGGETAIVIGGNLRLRGGRGTGYAWVAILPDKAVVTVTKRDGSWCAVTYGGASGYVMTKFLTFETAAEAAAPAPSESPAAASATPESQTTPPPTPALTPPPGGEFATVTGGSLKLRSAPSASAAWITAIPNKTRIIITKRNGTWCAVSYNGRSGHVMTEFLMFDDAPTQTTETPAPGTATPEPETNTPVGTAVSSVTAKVIGGTLKLSKLPDAAGSPLWYIPDQTVITVLEKGPKWCKVVFLEFTGYVLSEFLEFPGSSDPPEPTTAPMNAEDAFLTVAVPYITNCTATVTGGKTELYPGCTRGNAIATIPDKAQVHVDRMGDGWCHVSYNGKSGYVPTQNLIFTYGGEAPGNAAASSSTGKTVVRKPEYYTIAVGNYCAVSRTPGTYVRGYIGGDRDIAEPSLFKGNADIGGRKPGKTSFTQVEYDTDSQTTYLTAAYITVVKQEEAPGMSIELSRNTAYERGWVQTNGYVMPVGMVYHVYVTVTGAGKYPVITYRSTNPAVASVDANGVVTAKAQGTTTITISCQASYRSLPITVYSATTGGGMWATVRGERGVPLKMYRTASETAEVLTAIPWGQRLILLEKGITWCKVHYEGYAGYVKSDVLEFTTNQVEYASPVITPPPLIQ